MFFVKNHTKHLFPPTFVESLHSKDAKSLQRRDRRPRSESRREESKQRHKQLKRRQQRSSSEEEGETDGSEEDQRPLRRRSNRIETDDEEEDEGLGHRRQNTRGKMSTGRSSKVPGDSRSKHTPRFGHNGLVPLTAAAQDDDEDDEDEEEFTGVTDLVNFVFDSDQLS